MNGQSEATLTTWFDKTATKVKTDADWIEKEYLVPWRNVSTNSFEQQPVAFTFLGTFAVLSAVPIATFIGFAAVTLLVLVVSFLGAALWIATGAIAIAALFLVGVLLLQLFIASLVTVTGLGFYLTYRLLFHLRNPEGRGFEGWTEESKTLIPAQLRPQGAPNGIGAGVEPSGAEAASAHS